MTSARLGEHWVWEHVFKSIERRFLMNPPNDRHSPAGANNRHLRQTIVTSDCTHFEYDHEISANSLMSLP